MNEQQEIQLMSDVYLKMALEYFALTQILNKLDKETAQKILKFNESYDYEAIKNRAESLESILVIPYLRKSNAEKS